MDNLGSAYDAILDNLGTDTLPDDGVCPQCDKLVRNHPGVEKVLAARLLRYVDPDTGRLRAPEPPPYCICDQRGHRTGQDWGKR